MSRSGTARDAEQELVAAYERYVADVYGYIAYRLDAREDAEDLTQRTFELAIRAWSRFDPRRGAVRTWLLAIARNVIIDHHRAESTRRSATAGIEDPWSTEHGDVPGPRVLGPSAELLAALQKLDARSREVIALRFGGDLTTREIAEVMKLSVANVQQILSRSLRKLRSELEKNSEALRSGS